MTEFLQTPLKMLQPVSVSDRLEYGVINQSPISGKRWSLQTDF